MLAKRAHLNTQSHISSSQDFGKLNLFNWNSILVKNIGIIDTFMSDKGNKSYKIDRYETMSQHNKPQNQGPDSI